MTNANGTNSLFAKYKPNIKICHYDKKILSQTDKVNILVEL